MTAAPAVESTRPSWRIGPALLLGLVLLSLLPLGGMGLWQLGSFERSLRETVTEGLVSIARKKVAEIDAYLNEVQIDAQVVAKSADTRELLSQRRDAVATQVPAASRAFYAQLYDTGKYVNLLLVQPDGRISFAMKPLAGSAPDLARLDGGMFEGSGLLDAHRRALGRLDVQLTPTVQLRGETAQTLFLVHAVVDGDRVLGSIVLQLDMPRLLRVATDRAGAAVDYLKDPLNFPGGREPVVEWVLGGVSASGGQQVEATRIAAP